MCGHRFWWSCSVSFTESSPGNFIIGERWWRILEWRCRWQSGQRSHGSGIRPRVEKKLRFSNWRRNMYFYWLAVLPLLQFFFQDISCIGNTKHCIQHDIDYNKFSCRIIDNAAFILLCSRIRCKWHCTDCALDYGNHKRSILFFRNDHIYDIFLFWSIWFHQLEKKRNSDVENVNEREQAIFFWQAIISRRNKIACSLFVNIPFSRKRMIKTVLQIFLW